MHIKTPSIPLFVEGGNIFLHPNNDSYVSLRGIVGNWRNISVKASLNNNDDNVMFINRDNIEVTLPPDVPGHTIYFKRMSGGVRLTGGRILPAPGGQEVSYIDLDLHPASLSVWVIIGLCFIADNLNIKYENKFCTIPYL